MGTKVAATAGAIAIAALVGFCPAAAAVQVRFDVPEPFRIAGQEFSAGVISVQPMVSYTPSTQLLELWVDGRCLGMVTSRTVRAEVPSGRDEALFLRGRDGRLEMVGYRVAGNPSGRSFRFVEPVVPSASVAEPAPPASGAALAANLGAH